MNKSLALILFQSTLYKLTIAFSNRKLVIKGANICWFQINEHINISDAELVAGNEIAVQYVSRVDPIVAY